MTPAKEIDFSQAALNQCENCLLVLASPWGLKRHRLKCVGESAVKSAVESKAKITKTAVESKAKITKTAGESKEKTAVESKVKATEGESKTLKKKRDEKFVSK